MKKQRNKIRILLAEDDHNLGFVVMDNLKASGYEVSLCSDGEQALKVFADHPFDLCVLDVMMPKMDGFQVCQKLRQIKSFKTLPIIFLTGNSDKETVVKAVQVGGSDYFVKGGDIESLIKKIKTLTT